MNPDVDNYLLTGCGRCPLGNTPQCKVHRWDNELELLRMIVLDTGLTEELKWSVPCYTWQKSNIVILAAFNDYCSLSFFKGALLPDPEEILSKPGEHTQSARLLRFTSVTQVVEMDPTIRAFIAAAIEVEKSGLKVDYKEKTALDLPTELLQKMEENPALKTAFYSLTHGRQRAYYLHFSAPKQSKTRVSRIEKCIPQIMDGKGVSD